MGMRPALSFLSLIVHIRSSFPPWTLLHFSGTTKISDFSYTIREVTVLLPRTRPLPIASVDLHPLCCMGAYEISQVALPIYLRTCHLLGLRLVSRTSCHSLCEVWSSFR